MSNLTNTTSYGTRKPVSIAVNVPYMLRSIGADYESIIKMRLDQSYREAVDPSSTPSETEISEMEKYLNDLERKANLVQNYLDRNDISVQRFSRCDYFGFFVNDIQDFKDAYRDIIQEDKDRLANA